MPTPDEDAPELEVLRGLGSAGAAGDRAAEDRLLSRLDRALPRPPVALLAAIGVLSVLQLVLAAPWMVGADPFGLLSGSTDGHQARDGAFGVVIAVSGALTVRRPRWALPCFALAAVALVAQTVGSVIDDGMADAVASELVHLGSVVLTCLIGLAAAPLGPLGPTRGTGRRHLRAVDGD